MARPEVTASPPLLEVRDLATHLSTRGGVVKAVDGVSFTLAAGETLGLVGESGSGKTMTALSLVRLLPQPAGRIVSGEVRLDGEDLVPLGESAMRAVRGREIAMVLQDPMSSLNPVFTVGEQVREPIRVHRRLGRAEAGAQALRMLELVRIASPERRMDEYPHRMSGGMRQRVVGAIALSCRPRILIADEPTTALDVTVQAQYLALLKDIQRETGLAVVMITHDLGIVAKICDRVAVMYAGRIVETGPVRAVFDRPAHPYTRALLASLPRLEGRMTRLPSIEGQPPDLRRPPPGCRFAPRCGMAEDLCRARYPEAVAIGRAHAAACWFAQAQTLPEAACG